MTACQVVEVVEELPTIDNNLTEPDRCILSWIFDGGGDPGTLIKTIEDSNREKSNSFQPTIFQTWDEKDLPLEGTLPRRVLNAYSRIGSKITRAPTDVVFVTHLIIYFLTILPSSVFLFYNFTWTHACLHSVMTFWYMGTYTLMKHNHIHNNGILSRKYWMVDAMFPYILDPLFGHTWNSYYYHHVKHHHVEGNGPDDLSSTLRLQRDEIKALLYYIGRFALCIWIELPLYFYRKNRTKLALSSGGWEFANYSMFGLMVKLNPRPAIFVFILPFTILRLGLMLGNFGQHAFIDPSDPDSDYKSSCTILDVTSNRFCFNDGYHTGHHLNPLLHWRSHPAAFLRNCEAYAENNALVFTNIDYLGITYRLMIRDYEHLARCLVPVSQEQRSMNLEKKMAMLKERTRRLKEKEIERFWPKKKLA